MRVNGCAIRAPHEVRPGKSPDTVIGKANYSFAATGFSFDAESWNPHPLVTSVSFTLSLGSNRILSDA